MSDEIKGAEGLAKRVLTKKYNVSCDTPCNPNLRGRHLCCAQVFFRVSESYSATGSNPEGAYKKVTNFAKPSGASETIKNPNRILCKAEGSGYGKKMRKKKVGKYLAITFM